MEGEVGEPSIEQRMAAAGINEDTTIDMHDAARVLLECEHLLNADQQAKLVAGAQAKIRQIGTTVAQDNPEALRLLEAAFKMIFEQLNWNELVSLSCSEQATKEMVAMIMVTIHVGEQAAIAKAAQPE
jgi:hypothetical protein